MQLDVEIEGWPEGGWNDLAEQAAAAVQAIVPELANPRLIVSVLLTNDEQVCRLNREWRGKDKPTNVLSFPMLGRDDLLKLSTDGIPVMLGDLVLAEETCSSEAAEKAVSLSHHAAHLLVHGLLHLAGHEHETNDDDAEKMEALEIKALAEMGVADPYGDRNN